VPLATVTVGVGALADAVAAAGERRTWILFPTVPGVGADAEAVAAGGGIEICSTGGAAEAVAVAAGGLNVTAIDGTGADAVAVADGADTTWPALTIGIGAVADPVAAGGLNVTPSPGADAAALAVAEGGVKRSAGVGDGAVAFAVATGGEKPTPSPGADAAALAVAEGGESVTVIVGTGADALAVAAGGLTTWFAAVTTTGCCANRRMTICRPRRLTDELPSSTGRTLVTSSAASLQLQSPGGRRQLRPHMHCRLTKRRWRLGSSQRYPRCTRTATHPMNSRQQSYFRPSPPSAMSTHCQP